jgi:uncharacterized repeat protein (TIGR01451 family)
VKHLKKLLGTVALVTGTIVLSDPAYAAGTSAGTVVTNTATIDYQVAATPQTQAASNAVSFVVDRKINIVVAEVGAAATIVAPGQVSQVSTFTITNSSNSPVDVGLAATQQVGGAGPFGLTDNFNAANARVFVDVNGNSTYEAGIDTAIFADELAADATATVFIVVDVPTVQVNGDMATVVLTGTTYEAGVVSTLGAVVTQSAGADNPAAIDTVFADGAGTGGDIARDGTFSAKDQYDVTSASVVLVKQVRTVSDPFNGTNNPKAIPGAVLEYCLIVRNTGSVAASEIVLSDAVPTNTTYLASSARTEGSVIGTAPNDTCDVSAGASGGVAAGATFAANTVSATIATIAAGASKAARFSVTVN